MGHFYLPGLSPPQARIVFGDDDPTVTDVEGPTGSYYFRTDGNVYYKVDVDTWRISAGPSAPSFMYDKVINTTLTGSGGGATEIDDLNLGNLGRKTLVMTTLANAGFAINLAGIQAIGPTGNPDNGLLITFLTLPPGNTTSLNLFNEAAGSQVQNRITCLGNAQVNGQSRSAFTLVYDNPPGGLLNNARWRHIYNNA
jgi:hypothetical protein